MIPRHSHAIRDGTDDVGSWRLMLRHHRRLERGLLREFGGVKAWMRSLLDSDGGAEAES